MSIMFFIFFFVSMISFLFSIQNDVMYLFYPFFLTHMSLLYFM